MNLNICITWYFHWLLYIYHIWDMEWLEWEILPKKWPFVSSNYKNRYLLFPKDLSLLMPISPTWNLSGMNSFSTNSSQIALVVPLMSSIHTSNENVFSIFVGLNEFVSSIWDQILFIGVPLLSLNKVFSLVQEEQQWKIYILSTPGLEIHVFSIKVDPPRSIKPIDKREWPGKYLGFSITKYYLIGVFIYFSVLNNLKWGLFLYSSDN